MDLRDGVRKRVRKLTFSSLKQVQDLGNRAVHPHLKFLGIPPGNFEQIKLDSQFEFSASLLLKHVVNKR